MLERPRLKDRCISRDLAIVLPGPLGRVAVLGDEVEVLIALRPWRRCCYRTGAPPCTIARRVPSGDLHELKLFRLLQEGPIGR
jgi:hypothetical protein